MANSETTTTTAQENTKTTQQKKPASTRAPRSGTSGSTASRTRTATNRKSASRAEPASGAEQVKRWLGMTREELDDIYRKAKPGPLPQGDTRGTAILAGMPFAGLFAGLARRFAWQGKVFDNFGPNFESGVAVNKILPVGLNLIVAKTYRNDSWLDGKQTNVIDYSGTSMLARAIRDEIREVSPGLYLGKVWWGKRRILDFALETPAPKTA